MAAHPLLSIRPATIDDIARMEVIEAYVGASGITGKDRVAERGAVNAWVRRSVAWSNGEKSNESGVGDPESRRTIAWSIVTEADHDGDGELDAASSDNVIGMIFLIDIDGVIRSTFVTAPGQARSIEEYTEALRELHASRV